jgi:hypothetical protein
MKEVKERREDAVERQTVSGSREAGVGSEGRLPDLREEVAEGVKTAETEAKGLS